MPACSDDDGANDSGGTGGGAEGGAGNGTGGAGNGTGGAGNGTGGNGLGGEGGDGGGVEEPQIPKFFSFSGEGCGFMSPRNQLFPICRVNAENWALEDGNEFDVECWTSGGNPVLFTGEIAGGAFSLSTDSFDGSAWADTGTAVVCTSERGVHQTGPIECKGQAGEDEKTAACIFKPADDFNTGTTCIDLPSHFDSVQSGEVSLTDCEVAQDGCAFRAFCEEGAFQGLVNPEGIFNVTLSTDPPLASCRTNVRTSGELSGVCNVSTPLVIQFSEETETCAPLLGQEGEPHFFALDIACENPLATPQAKAWLGDEPSCAFRQLGCNWDLHCVDEDGRKNDFAGRLKPGDEKASFRAIIPGGPQGQFEVPCELENSGGNLAGACAVPLGNALTTTCSISEVANPSAGGAECENIYDAIDFESFGTHGCGPVVADCKVGFQHGCSFIGACDFGLYEGGHYLSGSVKKGPALEGVSDPSESGERDIMTFNGVDGFSCQAQKVLASEVDTYPIRWSTPEEATGRVNLYTRRVANEWYGTCRSARPHICRGTLTANNSTPEYQGLRLFFGDRAEIRTNAQGPLCGLDSNGNGAACEAP